MSAHAQAADPATRALRGNLWSALSALLLSSGTLVCCALPALLVAVGAGAAVAGLVSAVPQLIWLSEHKAGVFAVAGVALVAAGALQWYARRLPCPADPRLAHSCTRLRRASFWIYAAALLAYGAGALFAFALPALI